MSRADLLREAQSYAAMLRRCGYPEAAVAPEYCIDNVIGEDQFFTRTISVWAGPHKPETTAPVISRAFKNAMRKLKNNPTTPA
jgi:hypothetical protein